MITSSDWNRFYAIILIHGVYRQKRPIDYVPDNDNQVNQRIRVKLRAYMDKLLIDASISEVNLD